MNGRRRLDRILAPGYLDNLASRSTDEVRAMRDECEEEESGFSFARRVLQGRLDILRAEALRRRDAGPNGDIESLLDALPQILSDDVSARPLRPRVTRFLVPPSVQYDRRDVERIIAEQTIPKLAEQSTDELTEKVQLLTTKERELSALRRHLLDRLDALQDDLARRYRSGEANVTEVLPRQA